jgi:hypothetical protein
LEGGTVWIRSKLIAADTIDGAFTGLLIKGGALKLSAPAIIAAGVIVLNITSQFELDLELQDPAIPSSPPTGPGGDARAATVSPPVKMTLRGTAAGTGTVTQASAASLTAYGNTTALKFTAAAAHYDSHLNRILVPYKADAHSFNAAEVHSDLFKPAGSATISAAYWALTAAVPIGGPDQLGRAEGIGGLALSLAPGLSANWPGLRSRVAHNGPLVDLESTIVIVDPGQLLLSAAAIDATPAVASLLLWN